MTDYEDFGKGRHTSGKQMRKEVQSDTHTPESWHTAAGCMGDGGNKKREHTDQLICSIRHLDASLSPGKPKRATPTERVQCKSDVPKDQVVKNDPPTS